VKHARFLVDGQARAGVLDADGSLRAEDGSRHDPAQVRWLPPVQPGKMIGLALNYHAHATELGLQTPEAPTLFWKPNSTLIGHRESIVYPTGAEYMHYEAELAVVVGRRCRRVRPSDAMACVKGYTVANDVTVRDFVTNMFRPPIKAKGFDTFGPLGPFLVDAADIDPRDLAVSTRVNGQVRQAGQTSQFIHDIPAIIAFITSFMTLQEDDVILTGTPEGLSHIYPGDLIQCEVQGVGVLENRVVAETEA
jgi:5-oxopent-3-ene-1,2,5-tricarboxylate decarboxylase/2-hydroxyhepta-2,4-diene-1,7-dioate isomerase